MRSPPPTKASKYPWGQWCDARCTVTTRVTWSASRDSNLLGRNFVTFGMTITGGGYNRLIVAETTPLRGFVTIARTPVTGRTRMDASAVQSSDDGKYQPVRAPVG